tara:strand:- start:381 stop:572 length:192 start_codon:yes stop_codon:yes gene_type:complete
MVPILGPIRDPKITKYRDIVTAGGTNVCIHILRKRLISLTVRVHKATDIFRLLLILFFNHFDK